MKIISRREELSPSRGQGKRVGKMVVGAMSTVGLAVRNYDYKAMFPELSDEQIEDVKILHWNSCDFMKYCRSRELTYSHEQALDIAYDDAVMLGDLQ